MNYGSTRTYYHPRNSGRRGLPDGIRGHSDPLIEVSVPLFDQYGNPMGKRMMFHGLRGLDEAEQLMRLQEFMQQPPTQK